jgi:hypothetical protein
MGEKVKPSALTTHSQQYGGGFLRGLCPFILKPNSNTIFKPEAT